MSKIINIAYWEFTERVKRKYFIISTLLTPLFLIALGYFSGVVNLSTDEKPQMIGLYNYSEIPFANFQIAFDNVQLPNNQPKYILVDVTKDVINNDGNIAILENYVESQNLAAVVIVKSDSINNVSSTLITKYPKSHNEILLLEAILNQAKYLSNEVYESIKITQSPTSEIFEHKTEAELVNQFYDSFVLLILLLASILFSGGLFVRGLAEEKSNRIIEILLSSCKVNDILLGKILGLSLLGLFQILIWILLGYTFLSNYIFINNADFLTLQIIFFLLGYLFYTSVFVGLGSLVNSEYDSQQLTTNISIFLLVPIILALQIIEYPNSILAVTLSFFPLTSAPVMLLRFNTSVIPDWQIITAILSLLFFTGLFIFITSKIFGKGLLLFGEKSPYTKLLKWITSKNE
ncbi:MAG: ABC transporter permease [Ignavibacteriae bacterium]|nr:ABC transporter permease [Ignavibacteriota bacterium]NOG98727.1 ABC transporter permease [Ignavibacteriota bacterium]